MGMAGWVFAAYGLFTMFGGAIGYVKARSVASLVAGLAAGTVLLACASASARGGAWPLAVGGGIALVLGGRFARTWRRTRRLMPDLLMVGFSALTLASAAVVLVAGRF